MKASFLKIATNWGVKSTLNFGLNSLMEHGGIKCRLNIVRIHAKKIGYRYLIPSVQL